MVWSFDSIRIFILESFVIFCYENCFLSIKVTKSRIQIEHTLKKTVNALFAWYYVHMLSPAQFTREWDEISGDVYYQSLSLTF